MAVRDATAVKLETTKAGTRIHVRLRYDEGRKDEHRPRTRGYYVHVSSEEVDGEFVKVVLGTGGFCLVESATRFNQRRFDALKASLVGTPQLMNVINRVLERNGLALKDEELVPAPTAEEAALAMA